MGAGAKSEIGRDAIESDKDAVKSLIEGADMVFITAGMGGGTGTGAAPRVAQIAREMGVLTVGIVTLPFNFEGPKRMNRGLAGITELRKVCDTLISIPNQKLMSVVDKNTTVVEALKLADSVLQHASKGIADLINVHGLVNLDFADVETIMKNMGEAIIGTGTAKGEERAVLAAQQAISSPLLDNASISGAQGVLVNITGGSDLAIMEVDQATNIIFEEAGQGANIIFGAVIDPSLNDEIMVTVIATGFNHKSSSDELTNKRIESHLENQQQFKSVTEQENVPLHQQDTANTGELEQKQIENSAPAKLFDDLSPAMRENDLDVPAFIRRQQD